MQLNNLKKYDETSFQNWPDPFYETDDINERERLLLAHMEAHPNEEDEERLRIFKQRFEDGQGRPDCFMRAWLLIPVAHQNLSTLFSRKSALKDLHENYQILGISKKEPTEPLLEEWRAFAKKLIYVDATDPQYNSLIFGLGKMSDKTAAKKILSEIDSITRLSPRELGLEAQCAKLHNIMLQTYVQMIPDGHQYLSDLED